VPADSSASRTPQRKPEPGDGSPDQGQGGTTRCPTCSKDYPADFSVCPQDATPLRAIDNGDPLIGTVIAGTYRVTRMLASGGMGRLYEGMHARLEQPVAIKVMYESQALRRESIERAELEAKAMGKIRSEHVTSVIDLVQTADGRPGLVTELLHGEDLQQRIDREGKLAHTDAVDLTREICLGLAAAHAEGVIHRDMKPSNVFLAERRADRTIAKILDFGVAKTPDREGLTQTSAFLGTPAYMAPEQAAGASTVDGRADIYAVGAILYHACTGARPYGEDDATVTLMRLLREDPPRPRSIDPSLSEGLEAAIETLMARSPDDRPATAQEAYALLAPFGSWATPPGSDAPATVASAKDASRDAKRRRPLAIFRTAMLSIFGALWTAATVGELLIDGFGMPLEDPGARLGAQIGASLALGLGLVLGAGALRRSWRSGPRVEHLSRASLEALLAAALTMGLLDLGLMAAQRLRVEREALLPHDALVRLAAGGLAALLIFLWHRRSRDRVS